MNILRISRVILYTAFALSLTGCAAIGTAISHRNLETQTLMSKSIFLPPDTSAPDKTVYVDVHNTTDKPGFDITGGLESRLNAKGYQVVNDPSAAHYVLQVDLLQVGKNSVTAAQEMLKSGSGSMVEGALAGGSLAYVSGMNTSGLVVGALAGSVATTVTDNLVKNVTYTGIADVQISVNGRHKAAYATRILTLANRVNLSFETAMPQIENGLVNSISGIFN